MDPQIKRRMVMDILHWKCLSITDGDKNFDATPEILKGYSFGKEGIIVNADGVEVKTKTVVYLDGTDASKLGTNDEMQVPFGTRVPIQSIQPYASLGIGWELIEVRL